MPTAVLLTVTAGPLTGKAFRFERHDTLLFGRGAKCQARIAGDQTVSRFQFLLEVNPPEARLRDLGSLNGTFVNGTKCGGRAPDEAPDQARGRAFPQVDLKDGDRIAVGNTEFVFTVETPEPVVRHTVIESPACHRCGKDVTSERQEGTHGKFICAACRTAILTDSSGLRGLLQQAAHPVDDAEAPRINGYEIGEKLGRGGMGAVFHAVRKSTGQTVAVKVMLAQCAVDDHTRKLFLREIEVGQRLDHPHLVRVQEHGALGEAFYFVMEHCAGGSVSGLMEKRKKPLGMQVAFRILRQCLDGLAFAHDRGMIHRDIKPCNILIDRPTGLWKAKISDFGLAKSFEQAGLSGMTATGSFAGTYRFMPREQLTAFRDLQPVSDLWSLMATFYYMVTGAYPLDYTEERDPIDVLLQESAVPIRERNPAIPMRLAGVVDRALAMETTDRYPSAQELKKALETAVL